MNRNRPCFAGPILVAWILLVWPLAAGPADTKHSTPEIPKAWDEAALADWATPVAGLNVRPTHISTKEYYSLSVENLRTYPVYYPGREPERYWAMLQHVGPKPLIEPEKLKSDADWIEAGRRVFDEADHLHLRTFDPKLIAAARSREAFEQRNTQPLPDGTAFGLRWVPTKQGVALSLANRSNCHLLYLPDGTRVPRRPDARRSVTQTQTLITLPGGQQTRLPRWSPDGRSVAYLVLPRQQNDPSAGLWVDDLKNPPRQVFRGWVAWYAWARSGNIYLLEGKPDLNGVLWQLDRDGQRLKSSSASIRLPYYNWQPANNFDASPDGRHIAIEVQQVYEADIGMIENLR